MKNHLITRHPSVRLFCALLLALVGLGLSSSPLLATTYTYWTDGSNDQDWDHGGTGGNWSTTSGGPSGAAVPTATTTTLGYAVFSTQDPNGNTVTFSLAQSPTVNDIYAVLFQGNGGNYTIGSTSSSNGLFIDPIASYNGEIDLQGTLVGNNGYEKIDAPVDFTYLNLENFSPYDTTTAKMANEASYIGGGYGNVLTIDNKLTSVTTGDVANHAGGLSFGGDGKIVLSSTSTLDTSAVSIDMVGGGTAVISGANVTPFTLTIGGGNLILDDTTNNVARLLSTSALTFGGNRNGGHLTLNGNAAGTTETVKSMSAGYGFHTITVNGASGGTTTTFNLGTISSQAPNAGFMDISNNATGVVTTTTTTAGVKNSAAATVDSKIIGQWMTYDENSWATSGAYTGTTVKTITGYAGDGDLFNDRTKNFDVDDGGETLVGFAEGANTVRFNGATGGELDLNGGTLTMDMGGILVASNVTQNTSIGDGSLTINSGGTVTIFNYGTGTFTLSADIATNQGFGRGGYGTIVLSGNNVAMVSNSFFLDSGTTRMGSATALGGIVRATPATDIGNTIYLGDGTTVLDLNGYSPVLSGLSSYSGNGGGNAAAAAGLVAEVTNSKAGSISRLTLAGVSGSTSNLSTAGVSGVSPNLMGGVSNGSGNMLGAGFVEGAGAILALDIQQGSLTAGTGQVLFNIGASTPVSYIGTVNYSGVATDNIFFTGSVTIGAHAGLGSSGYDNGTTGVLVDNGLFGASGGTSTFGSTYFTGTGSILGSLGGYLYINLGGSAVDNFAGTVGTSSAASGLNIVTEGTGKFSYGNVGYAATFGSYGTSSITTQGYGIGEAIVDGLSSQTVTGGSGTVLGGVLNIVGGTLNLTPALVNSSTDITYATGNNNFQYGGDAIIVLNNNGNHSLTFDIGTTAYGWSLGSQTTDGTIIIGSAQGLASIGSATGDKFVVINTSHTASPITLTNGISSVIFGQNDATGGRQEGTFLTYIGTSGTSFGNSTDTGLQAYSFAAGNINTINSSTATAVEQITNAQSLGADHSVYALEIDNGGGLTLGGHALTFAGGDLVLNGASILRGSGDTTGTVKITAGATHVYTDLDNGTISAITMTNTANVDLVKDGAGLLTIGTLTTNANNKEVVNGGALDIGNVSQLGTSVLVLSGGVLQGNGTFTSSLTTTAGTGGTYFSGGNAGGFSARGGALTVTLKDGTTGSTNLIWGTTANFLSEGGVLEFGSTTSDSKVTFTNNLDLGYSGNMSGTNFSNLTGSIYDRVIDVTANTADATASNVLAVTDYTEMSGTITNANTPYAGVSKDGNGLLLLSGTNTYTGATTIANGTLVITKDSSLGAAPTAADALNTTQTTDTINGGSASVAGVAGNALTPGAIEINGGATLALQGGTQTLSANRQLLLASGATGASAAYIDVDKNYTSPGVVGTGYAELDFGGMIADYVNEKGSLEKTGDGTFNYSGTASNTGTMAVSAGTFTVSGAGSVNSASGVTINNKSTNAATAAQFNYGSSVALSEAVTYGTGGGTFAYNSQAVYTGATAMTLAAKDVISGAGKLSSTAFTLGAGSTILPGNVNGQAGTATVGTLTTGGLILQTGGNYNFLLADATGAAGVGYSTVGASSVDLSGLSTGGKFNINLESLALNIPGSAADFNGSNAYTFVLIATNQQITGTTAAQVSALFNVNTAATNGATGLANAASGTWQVVESADGTDLDLVYGMTVPEPSTWVMLAGGLGLLVVIRRSRQRVG